MWLWWCGNVCLIKDDALLHGKFLYNGLWYNLRNRQPGRRHEFERSASLQGWVLCYFYIRRGDMHWNMLVFRLVCRSYSWRGAETLVIKIKDTPSFLYMIQQSVGEKCNIKRYLLLQNNVNRCFKRKQGIYDISFFRWSMDTLIAATSIFSCRFVAPWVWPCVGKSTNIDIKIFGIIVIISFLFSCNNLSFCFLQLNRHIDSLAL